MEVYILTVSNLMEPLSAEKYDCRLIGIYDSMETAKQKLSDIDPNLLNVLHIDPSTNHTCVIACGYVATGDLNDYRVFTLHCNIPINEAVDVVLYEENIL